MLIPLPILLGYRPRRPMPVAAGFDVPGVIAVASASNCITDRVICGEPEWDEINTAYHYPTVRGAQDAAKRVSNDPCEIHATLLYPLVFDKSQVHSVDIRLRHMTAGLDAAVPLEDPTETLGFDIVSLKRDDFAPGMPLEDIVFECAPLSCNLMGREIPVNRWCLLDRWEDAASAAKRLSLEEPEPGSYVIVAVERVQRAIPTVSPINKVSRPAILEPP